MFPRAFSSARMLAMGLLYPFPASESEVDRIDQTESSITLKTYGLPMIFWGYLAAFMVVLFAMILAIKGPLMKMMTSGDFINEKLAYLVLFTLFIIPMVSIMALFYEKWLHKSGDDLTVIHRVFFLPVLKKRYELDKNTPFVVDHFMDSPNIAKLEKKPEMRAFEKQRHFLLRAHLKNQKFIVLDRHSRKADLVKISELLKKY